MAGYEKQTWVDDETVGTADRFNHMEEGIVLASKTGGVEVGTIVNIDKDATVQEGYEEVSGKSIIQVGYNGSTAFTISTTNTKTFVPMAKQLSKIGNGFTVQSDGTVLVNKTMKIRAKAQVMLTASGSGAKILMIDINQYDWSYDRVVSLKDYVPLKSDTYILDVKEGDILRLYYQGDANDTFHTSTAFVYMYIEEVDDPNKLIKKVSATELDPITGSIVDGTNIDDKVHNTYSANTIDGLVSDDYSTTEQVIGTWLGKPLYRKIVGTGNLPNTTYTNVTPISSDIEVKRIYGYCTSEGTTIPLPYVNVDNVEYGIQVIVSGGNLMIKTNYDWSAYTGYIIIEYTKTTD